MHIRGGQITSSLSDFSCIIIDNTELNSTKRDCDLIFSGSITLTGYMIWDLLIGITW